MNSQNIKLDYQSYVALVAGMTELANRDKHLPTIADKWKQARKNLKSAWMAEIDAMKQQDAATPLRRLRSAEELG